MNEFNTVETKNKRSVIQDGKFSKTVLFSETDNSYELLPFGITEIERSTEFNYPREFICQIVLPDSIASIGPRAFEGCKNLKDIYYGGSKEDWKKIEIGDGNKKLGGGLFERAKIHYNNK